MKRFAIGFGSLLIAAGAFADGHEKDMFSGFDLVAEDGSFSLPEVDFRKDWTMLGAWITGGAEEPANGMHNVYTQPGVVEAFRENGAFPDGTVLVKELLGVEHGTYTTGPVAYAGEIEGWFVMIKDAEGRYPESGLWGDGWGWAFFSPDDKVNTPTTDYEAECIGCHVPAEENDWIYVEGYPVLEANAE